MKKPHITTIAAFAIILVGLGGIALAQQDKYSLKVPGGLAFSEFRGYESWQVCFHQSEQQIGRCDPR